MLDDTAVAFASACTWINDNVNSNLTNRNSIQAVCYSEVKFRFGLTANHVIRACARVGANGLTAKQKRRKVNPSTPLRVNIERSRDVKGFKPTSFDCDARTFRFIEEGYLVSLSTTAYRVQVPMGVSNYHVGKLQGQNPSTARVCKHRDGNFYVHIQLKSEAPKPKKSKNVIGVDFGRRDIAVTSTGKSWAGKSIQKTRDKYSRVRASLQKKASQGKSASPGEGLSAWVSRAVYTPRVSPGVYAGRTRSTRPRSREILKRLSGREKRYQQWLNHNPIEFNYS